MARRRWRWWRWWRARRHDDTAAATARCEDSFSARGCPGDLSRRAAKHDGYAARGIVDCRLPLPPLPPPPLPPLPLPPPCGGGFAVVVGGARSLVTAVRQRRVARTYAWLTVSAVRSLVAFRGIGRRAAREEGRRRGQIGEKRRKNLNTRFQQMSSARALAVVGMTRLPACLEFVGLKGLGACVTPCCRQAAGLHTHTPYSYATSLKIAQLWCARAAHGVRKWVIRVANMYIHVLISFLFFTHSLHPSRHFSLVVPFYASCAPSHSLFLSERHATQAFLLSRTVVSSPSHGYSGWSGRATNSTLGPTSKVRVGVTWQHC